MTSGPYGNPANDPFYTIWTIVNGSYGPIFVLIVLVLIFFLIREILTWYWKINERLDVLYDIKRELVIMNRALRSFAPTVPEAGSTMEYKNEPMPTSVPAMAHPEPKKESKLLKILLEILKRVRGSLQTFFDQKTLVTGILVFIIVGFASVITYFLVILSPLWRK